MNWCDPKYVDRYLATYDETFSQQIPDQLNRLGDLSGKVFVELGCGAGEFLVQAAHRAEKCIGVDISPEMCRRTREKIQLAGLKNTRIICSDLSNWHPEDESVDVVWSVATIHHLTDEEKRKLFCNVFRALRPAGKLVIQDMMFDFGCDEYEDKFPLVISSVLAAFADRASSEVLGRDLRATLYAEHPAPSSVVKKLMQDAGFEAVQIDQKSEAFADIEAVK